ncbi:uncharacterized protein ARMOST_09679 [Armillaria ostoyae]|uniref:BAG domain-containing protein n=1 Tax=Armillaria ostoyae TaxID=47428 RepID=A0A284RC56_ARMOS|nr:uncharacterized protein ARMOST_09679 [Armillaria ostoyae]
MFPYNTPNTFYPTRSPRDKYLVALAMAKEAEEEYLASEAAVEYEERALRRRLEELELEKRRLRGIERYRSYDFSEAEERFNALVGPAEAIERQNLYRRQGAVGLARYHRELEAQRAHPYARNDAFIQSPPSFPYTFGTGTILPKGPKRSPLQFVPALAAREEAPKHPPCAGRMQVKRYGLGQPLPSITVRQAKAAVPTNNNSTAEAPAPNAELLRAQAELLRAQATAEAPAHNGTAELLRLQAELLEAQARAVVSTNNNCTAEAPAPSAIAEFLRAIHVAEVKASPVAPHSSAPSTPKSTEVVPESKKSETEPQQPSHITVEECLGAMLGHVAQRVEASASRADATTCRSTPVVRFDDGSPFGHELIHPFQKTSEVESSLKAELEARLNNDQSNEIKDTIHAIFASLNDAHSNAPSSSSKGKEKAHPISAEDATSKDVVSSMEAVRNVETAFHALESEFVFPIQLDFTPAPSPASSDSESSLTGRLAYTSRNAPVRYYEQSLSGLLAQLDSVESFGNEALRSVRKEVVGKVESALEELEREVEGRWRSKTAKEAKEAGEQDAVNAEVAEKVVTSEVSAPAESVKGDELAAVDAPTPVEAVAVGDDEAVAVDATLETSIVTPQPEPTESLVVSDIISESSASVTEHPLPASVDPPTSAYPPSSASIDTIRPYDVESQSSEDPQESFLLSEDNSADQQTATKKKADDDTGSDWSEVEA